MVTCSRSTAIAGSSGCSTANIQGRARTTNSGDAPVCMTRSSEPSWPRGQHLPILGVFGGLALGVFARAWMRLIADDPAFTMAGSAFVIAAFSVFGLTQATATGARRAHRPRWKLVLARGVGAVGILPLFAGAGLLMAP